MADLSFCDVAAPAPEGLYVHVPFCVRKCGYCDFYSLPQPKDRGAPDATRYLAALERELEIVVPRDFRARTVFIGGGTPTELATPDLARLLEMIAPHARDAEEFARQRERVEGARVPTEAEPRWEWTVESNPGTLTREKALLLREAGVTRVSMGVQSLDPESLAFLGRIHSAEEAVAGYRLLREVGFTNVNLDLIFGIPGSSRERIARDVAAIADLGPEHISCYCLIFEEGTPLFRLREAGLVFEVDEDEELAQYRLVRATLRDRGYAQYEISNFARAGRECRHNLLYWGAGSYYGLGPSAHGHVAGARAANVRDLGKYCAALVDEGKRPLEFEERLDPERKAAETLVMGLRRIEGVSGARFREETGLDLEALRGREIERLCGQGLLERAGDRVRLTESGLFLSDTVFAELV